MTRDILMKIVTKLGIASLALSSSFATAASLHIDSAKDWGNGDASYPAANAIDGSLDWASRWVASGSPVNLQLDLGSTETVSEVGISWGKGSDQTHTFEIYARPGTSGDWTKVYDNLSSGSTSSIEVYDIDDIEAQQIRIKTFENSAGSDTTNIKEVEVYGTSANASDGLDPSTGYAENYAVTGKEMTLDFASVSWNTVNVNNASQLQDALSDATAGDKIIIASGTYVGNFKLKVGGSKSKPVWIIGENASNMPILDGDDYNNNTTLAIDGDNAGGIGYIYVENIKVTNARTGISVDQADYVTIDGVEIYEVGQSAIHLRDGSKYSIVKNNTIHDTGLYNVKYGEGIYIGSDYTKWPGGSSSSEYDPAVDYVQILNNVIGPNVTAEHIDVKEGSSYAYIIGNTFDAEGMNDIINGGLSFIDFKGNYAEAAYNTGGQNDNEYFENAFEINEKSSGWGAYNAIHNNTVTFDDEYYNKNSVSVTITLPLGSGGDANSVKTTDTIKPTHWVVKNNVDGSNSASDNTRIATDEDKMYSGF